MNEPIVNWGLIGERDGFEGQIGNLARTPGVNTTTLTISAMGSLMTSESQDTCLTYHLKDGTLHRPVSPITALGN